MRTHLQLVRIQRQLARHNEVLEGRVRERTRELHEKNAELERTRLEIIRRLGRAAEYKDNETGLHVIRMSHYSRILAQAAGLPPERVELVFQSAPMHDIGKIGIPDRILLKPGRLDDNEWQVMRQHPGIGAGIIGRHNTPLLETARVVALSHHEKWDGTGYPRGLREEEIPLEGRIVAVADVFDALTSDRPYKPAWSVEDTLGVLTQEAGRHFDPNLIPLFLGCMDQLLEIRERWGEGDHAGDPGADALMVR
ncbi:MAG: HD domain-containing protein [Magnetococcus sp. WYHC-3]